MTSGQGHLQGYELYDLVALSESEMAVVVGVGAEKLKIITNADAIKEVFVLQSWLLVILYYHTIYSRFIPKSCKERRTL